MNITTIKRSALGAAVLVGFGAVVVAIGAAMTVVHDLWGLWGLGGVFFMWLAACGAAIGATFVSQAPSVPPPPEFKR